MDYDKAAEYWTVKDRDNVKMESELLKTEIEKFISKHKVCAFAAASGSFVRCTPIEYNYINGCFYMFSEGGLKFKALKDNKHVSLAVYDENASFGQLSSLQVTGTAEIVEPWTEEYMKLLDYKKISAEALNKMDFTLNLIKIVPEIIDFLKSDLKKQGFSSRQQLVLSAFDNTTEMFGDLK